MNTNLRLDVNVLDSKNIIKWLRNKDVTKFLNEDKKILPLHSLMAFTTGRGFDQHHLFYRHHPCIQRRASDNNGI